MRRIVMSGLVALAAVLGGTIPAAAGTQPATRTQPAATRWAASAARPAAGGSITGTFPKLSCVTGMDCLGIDGSSTFSATTAIPASIARWNGSTWKRAHWTLPKGARSIDLGGVSCKAAKSCLVVGDYYTGASDNASSHPLALIYNGTSLKPTPAVPLPKSTLDAALTDVSCATYKHCVAVGTAYGNTAAFGSLGMVSLIETWNGAKWTVHTVSSPANTDLQISNVSCATSAYCLLAGESLSATGSSTLYLRSWNGTKLTVLRPAAAGSSTALPVVSGASCSSSSNCAVSGLTENPSSSTGAPTAFTEIWNGKKWRTAAVPWRTGTAISWVMGVSCFGAHSCGAVGVTSSGTAANADGHPAAASYNGTSWALQTVPVPAQGRTTFLTDVTCLSAAKCVAVGETGLTTAAAGATMTGVWNGKAWKFDPGF